jgi:hypothetical protein
MTGLDRLALGTDLKNIFPRGDIWVLILLNWSMRQEQWLNL